MRFLAFLLVVAALFGGAYALEEWHYTQPGPGPQGSVLLIVPGDGVNGISAKLEQSGAVDNAQFFAWSVRLHGESSRLKAGEYAVPPHASPAEIVAILASGRSIQHKFTAAEGLTTDMIYRLVRNDSELEGDAGAEPPEGTLLPETYLFTRGTTRAQLLARMERAQEIFVQARWSMRAPNLPLRTPEEAVTLASIVEKETALPAERRHIAAVFINRLMRGMKLQSDPTIIYGVSRGFPLGRGIRQSELSGATPYNTYVIAGLPPTPICNPGKDAIAAVLSPANSQDLYFVADGTGGHVFSNNVEDHLRNVARWRKIEAGRRDNPLRPDDLR
jgi:UPF0755 protein